MQTHVHEEIDHVEYTVKAGDDETIDSVWFFFGDVPERPGDKPAVVFWLRSEQHRASLRTALLMAADALDPTQASDSLDPPQ